MAFAPQALDQATRALSARRDGPLCGRLRPPGDRSMSRGALIMGLLCVGETTISGLAEGDDVMRLAQACRMLGAKVEPVSAGVWSVRGAGLGTLVEPRATLDLGGSGAGARLMAGVIASHGITATLDGDASLRQRPMARVLEPLVLMGARVLTGSGSGRLPLTLRGASEPAPIEYATPVASAQLKSAILLAALNSPGRTTVVETGSSRDHTEKLLGFFGAAITSEPRGDSGRRIVLQGRPDLRPRPVVVPVDPALAAFPLVAALIVPGSEVVVEGVMLNPLRMGLLDTLREMGADIEILEPRVEAGETIADLRARHGDLRGVDAAAVRPTAFEDMPALAMAAAFARGQTRLRVPAGTREAQPSRPRAIVAGLRACGVDCAIEGGDLVVSGAGSVRGGALVETGRDHGVALAFLVLGLAAGAPVAIDEEASIGASFPAFRQAMAALGAQIG